MVSELKVAKSGISPGSYGGRGARERLRKVSRVVCGWRVGLGAYRTSSGLLVMEELGLMCDGGDC